MPPEILEQEAPIQEEPSLRETIENAIDASDDSSARGPGTPAGVPGEEKPAAPGAGQEATPPAKPAPDQQPDGAKPAAAAGAPATPAGATPAPTGELKAPSQWKPAVREKWNALPREVQEEVLRRESDSLRLIGSVGPKIRLADEVTGHLQPFMEKLSASGAHPSDFLGDVFTTIKSLSGGSPQERAEVVANIIQSYGVDLATLDQALTRRISAPPEVMEARRATAQAQAYMNRQRLEQSYQGQQGAAAALSAFAADPKNEFFNDVRTMMADLMTAGQAQNLNDAYAAAVWANPDTRKILLQREAEARAGQKNDRAAAARRASSSVHGTPRGPGAAPGIGANLSLRDTIAAAMDAQETA